jgi:hypothetical protein
VEERHRTTENTLLVNEQVDVLEWETDLDGSDKREGGRKRHRNKKKYVPVIEILVIGESITKNPKITK